jgi:hypothetical protein
MKTVLLLISISIFFVKCNTPYYTSVNDMKGQPGSITLTNGTLLNGKLNVKVLNSYYSIDYLEFAEGTATEYKHYKLSEIKLMYINGSNYYVKTIVGNNVNRDIQRFLKEITLPGGRMGLYENEVVTKNTSTNTTDTKTQYFVQLPNAVNNEIYSIESSKFTPKFDEKMSAFVQDCPVLADKIRSKDKDYFYPFLLSDNSVRRKAVLLQIINDYNACK